MRTGIGTVRILTRNSMLVLLYNYIIYYDPVLIKSIK